MRKSCAVMVAGFFLLFIFLAPLFIELMNMKKIRNYLLLLGSLLWQMQAFAQEKKGWDIVNPDGDFYIYTTYGYSDGSRFPSNSMYVVTGKGIVMIDVPWDTAQTIPFLDKIEQQHHKKVIACISTHFHADRTAGLDILKRRGIATYGSQQTIALCKERKQQQPEYAFVSDTTFHFDDHTLTVYYPGAGHSPDNIVIWFGKEKILYGGCFIKSTDYTDLGNLSDARPEQWGASVKKVQKRFPGARFVIPGHGSWKGVEGLEYTLKLIGDYKRTAH